MFVALGLLAGAFTSRALVLLPLCAVLYAWPLRRFHARWRARLDRLRARLEG
jgi:hypothetical protein